MLLSPVMHFNLLATFDSMITVCFCTFCVIPLACALSELIFYDFVINFLSLGLITFEFDFIVFLVCAENYLLVCAENT